MKTKQLILSAITACLTLFTLMGSGQVLAANTDLPANRYNLPRNYHSEISSAEAYLNAIANRSRWGREHEKHHGDFDGRRPVIVDVRSIPEYTAGHPQGAYNIPYPFIYQECAQRQPDGACINGGARIPQTDEALVNAVLAAIPDKDTPIYTLCRTGHRSVLAANVLTAAGYTHVRNIWQGFVGQTKVDFFGNAPLDLNHDGKITDADKDGWRYYQKLPYTKRLRPGLIYQPYAYLYY